MSRTTIFLRQPVGVAIHTDDYDTYAEILSELDTSDFITVKSDKAAVVIVPVDNIASVEMR